MYINLNSTLNYIPEKLFQLNADTLHTCEKSCSIHSFWNFICELVLVNCLVWSLENSSWL